MKTFNHLGLFFLLVVFSSLVFGADNKHTWELDELEFQSMRDGSIEIAVLHGDPKTGPSSVMMRFSPNSSAPMHLHTYNYHALVVSGATKHWVEGEQEADVELLGPGDFFFQKGGQLHGDSFPAEQPTVLFVRFDGPIDSMSGVNE